MKQKASGRRQGLREDGRKTQEGMVGGSLAGAYATTMRAEDKTLSYRYHLQADTEHNKPRRHSQVEGSEEETT